MERPPGSELQKQTLWLFGVLVALAIREGISGVFRHVAEEEHFWGGSLEVLRLFIFLIVVVRFYLGAVQYFYGVYGAQNADADYPDKSFRLDFLFGFVHFTIFGILAMTATVHGPEWWLFPSALGFVLSYDAFWYVASRRLSTRFAIRMWTVINAVTVAFALLFFLIPAILLMWLANDRQMNLTPKQLAACELTAYIPVLLSSMVDLGSLLHKQSAIEQWLSEAIHRPKALGG